MTCDGFGTVRHEGHAAYNCPGCLACERPSDKEARDAEYRRQDAEDEARAASAQRKEPQMPGDVEIPQGAMIDADSAVIALRERTPGASDSDVVIAAVKGAAPSLRAQGAEEARKQLAEVTEDAYTRAERAVERALSDPEGDGSSMSLDALARVAVDAAAPAIRAQESAPADAHWHEVWVWRDAITGKLHTTTGSSELSSIPPVSGIQEGSRRYVDQALAAGLSDEDRERLKRIADSLPPSELSPTVPSPDQAFLRKLATPKEEGAPRGVENGDLTRWILDGLELPADDPGDAEAARMQRVIQAAVVGWFTPDRGAE